ncbi:MAG: mechanosensitive ion channel family protein [Proteobacteria bacterium]|nr:mechanosensitive ion channel family protein [Pseudomonadota bacterium]
MQNPWVILGVMAVLVAYRYAAFRTKKMPHFPIGLLILYLALNFVHKAMADRLSQGLLHWIDTAAVIALYCAVARLIFALTVELWVKIQKKERLPALTKDFLLAVIYAVIIFLVLREKGGANLAGLITTSAVLTAVIGLAAQSTLGNLFAGLSLQLERPYSIGDWIQYGEKVGRVVGIGWKSTRLLNFESELVYVPNLDIIKTVLTNFSRPSRLHTMKINVGIEYGAAPNRVRRVMLDTLREEPRILKTPAPSVRVMEYGDFAITYMMRFAYEDYGVSPELRASVMNRLWYALRRNGIRIPFPIRDVHHAHIERAREEELSKKQRGDVRARLDSVPILAPLSHEEKESLARSMRIESYAEGETVVWQGDPGDSMYVIHSGACDVLVGKDSSIPVATLAPPSFFGEMSLLTGEPRSATVRATADSTLFAIDKALFSDILSADVAILERLAQALAERQAETNRKLGEGERDRSARVQGLSARIRSFFGLT